ncbi:hypothetical protein FQN52_003943 [Onygenales sp. PD_12]|nr:hypothetical protein FQN52_003943 [Onygenales sp. PD_12]
MDHSTFQGGEGSGSLPDKISQFRSKDLSGPASLNGGKCYYLVVCGCDRPQSHWIFSDFMGYCYLLKEQGIEGDFLNCMDLDAAFGLLSMDNISSITFGQGREGEGPLLRYSRSQHAYRQRFFRQVEPDAILQELTGWVRTKAGVAVPGDIINIILESHGSRHRIQVGTKWLTREDSTMLCNEFKQGVQVNFITGACYSGIFIDSTSSESQKDRWSSSASSAATTFQGSISNRIRNSRYSQAFVQSLSRIVLPGIQRTRRVTVDDHDSFMRRETYRSISGLAPGKSVYQSYIEPTDLARLVEDMVFRKKIDVLYDPTVTSSRRRVEYPSLDTDGLRRFLDESVDTPEEPQHPNPTQVKADLKSILVEEKKHCDPNRYMPSSEAGPFNDFWFQDGRPHRYPHILTLMYWRGRVQNAAKDIFFTLFLRGLISLDGLTRPIDMGAYDPKAGDMLRIITCFRGPLEQSTVRSQCYEFDFDDPFHWLSVVILRGLEAPLEMILETIVATKFFGEFDMDEYGHASVGQKEFSKSPDICLGKPGQGCGWGFWLPYQLHTSDLEDIAEAFEAGRRRFNAIERCFRDWFGIRKEDLLLESEQEDFFLKYPHLEPGYRFSGQYLAQDPSVSGGSPDKGHAK